MIKNNSVIVMLLFLYIYKIFNKGIVSSIFVVTLIVLLILAGVSLTSIFSDKGIFSRAENAGEKYNEAKAREVLETVLLTDGQYEKNMNPEYNQDEFLDDLIKNEISGSNVKGDVAIIGKYAYELDRSVPKIGRYLGKAEDLVFPTVTATDPVIANDYRSTSFTVTALEEKNGINKIEIWFAGEKIETLTKIYNNIKTEITESFTVNRNGKYTIKAYGDLMASTTVEVTGIVPMVEFSPNKSTEWKKQHSSKIIVKETGERVTSLKYKWTTSSANEPAESEFIETCPTDNIITGKDFTGTYYLWVLLTTETGKTNICGSEGFNFDNEGPTVTLDSTPVSETSFTITATASDTKSGIAKYEFYIENTLVATQEEPTYTWTGTGMEEKNCYVIVTDKAGNTQRVDKEARTKLYTWEIYEITRVYELDKFLDQEIVLEGKEDGQFSNDYVFEKETGVFRMTGAGGSTLINRGHYIGISGSYVLPNKALSEKYNGDLFYFKELISCGIYGSPPCVWIADIYKVRLQEEKANKNKFIGITRKLASDVFPNDGPKRQFVVY